MGRTDKEFEARMAGMLYAYNYAKQNGIDELEKEVRRRGYTQLPLKYSDTQIKHTIREISSNTYNMMMTAFLYAAHETFGFGLDRLTRLKTTVDGLVNNVFDLDYMGEHYISMGDYAEELCEKYGPLVDVMKVKSLQQTFDNKDDDFHTVKAEKLIEVMRNNGYDDAASWLEKKIN